MCLRRLPVVWAVVCLLAASGGPALGLEFKDQIVGDVMPGWNLRGQTTTPGSWIVRDGVLECTGRAGRWGEWIGTERDYTDFVIEFEYKISPDGNSGVYLRTPPTGHPSRVSMEIQLLDDYAEKYAKLVPAQYTGSIYKVVAPSRQATKPAGEWNHMRITADRDHVMVVINGQVVVDATGREYPELLNRSPKGAIGFQNHRTPVWFRNIRIADLAADRAERSAWWRNAKFGMFIHWGIYSVLGEGEWNMKASRIPGAEYQKLAPRFNPSGFDAAEWAALARRAGQRYVVFTSKHHDGFAMFDSKVSDYDIMDATPFKRDVVKELAEAFRAEGLRFGIYHSVLDWHHPEYEPVPDWDPARAGTKPDIDKYFAYLTAQVRELCTGYGRVACWWWDGAWDHNNPAGRRKLAEVNAMIRELQPGILVNNRAATPGDFETPERYVPATGLTSPDGSPVLWESCMTLSAGRGSRAPGACWGYDKNETQYESAEHCIRMLVDVVSKGGNLLLNVGPTPEGRIQQVEAEVLEAIGRWLEVNGEAIYGTTASPFPHLPFFGRTTVKGSTLYVHIFDWPSNRRIELPGLTTRILTARVLGDPTAPLAITQRKSTAVIHLSEKPPHPAASVVAVELQGPPNVEPFVIRPDADGEIRLPATFAEIRAQLGQRARFASANEKVYVGNWTNANDTVCWRFEADKPGPYEVRLSYNAEPTSEGATFEAAVIPDEAARAAATQPADSPVAAMFNAASASAKLQAGIEATSGSEQFEERPIGTIDLATGTNLLLIRPLNLPAGASLMNLQQATLSPVQPR